MKTTEAGFTLLEILIAIFIFAIIATTIFGSFNAVFSHSEAIRHNTEIYEMARNCIDRMMTDLEAIYFPMEYEPQELGEEDPDRIEGKNDELRFRTRAHVALEDKDNASKIAEVVYYLENSRDGNYVLKRADNLEPFHDSPEKKVGDPILCEKVKSLKFLYYDEEGKDHDHWESDSDTFKYATPKAIGIRIEIADDTSSLFFETMIAFPFFRPEKQ